MAKKGEKKQFLDAEVQTEDISDLTPLTPYLSPRDSIDTGTQQDNTSQLDNDDSKSQNEIESFHSKENSEDSESPDLCCLDYFKAKWLQWYNKYHDGETYHPSKSPSNNDVLSDTLCRSSALWQVQQDRRVTPYQYQSLEWQIVQCEAVQNQVGPKQADSGQADPGRALSSQAGPSWAGPSQAGPSQTLPRQPARTQEPPRNQPLPCQPRLSRSRIPIIREIPPTPEASDRSHIPGTLVIRRNMNFTEYLDIHSERRFPPAARLSSPRRVPYIEGMPLSPASLLRGRTVSAPTLTTITEEWNEASWDSKPSTSSRGDRA